MRAFHLTAQTGPDALRLVEIAPPVAGPGQVLVRVRALSLNFRDLMVADGRYGEVTLPLVPLSDGAGEIAAVGAGVTGWKVGDRVAGTFFQAWTSGPFRRQTLDSALGGKLPGMAAEFVVLGAEGVIALPEHLSFAEGATLPCAGLTAWQALVTRGNVSADETVVVLGTGGVSIFALQFARLHGARVIVTSSDDGKLERARALGAAATINYRTQPEWEKEVYRLTGKAGADQIVEVGGAGTLARSVRALAPGGQIHVVGGVSGFSSEISLHEVIRRMAVVRGIFVGSRGMFAAMNQAIATNGLRPVIDRVFPFAELAHAYRHQLGGSHFGKVVVAV
jgi:NADPH:quinone reductase-like Zn-dependent oxidoreductase